LVASTTSIVQRYPLIVSAPCHVPANDAATAAGGAAISAIDVAAVRTTARNMTGLQPTVWRVRTATGGGAPAPGIAVLESND